MTRKATGPMRPHDAPAVFTAVTPQRPLTEVDCARGGVVDLAAACEIDPDLADEIHEHLDRVEAAIRTANACI